MNANGNPITDQQQYEQILKCRTNYINASLCQNIRGKRDKTCLSIQNSVDQCLKQMT